MYNVFIKPLADGNWGLICEGKIIKQASNRIALIAWANAHDYSVF
jgi:hypothetical protein